MAKKNLTLINFTPQHISNFESRVDKKSIDQCWPWTGPVNYGGYGMFSYKGNSYPAHRVAYFILYKNIPDGFFICHHCDNPPCCNPHHLFAGTPADNTKDAMSKGRQGKSRKSVNIKKRDKLNPAKVRLARQLKKIGISWVAIAIMFRVTPSTMAKAGKRITWRHVK